MSEACFSGNAVVLSPSAQTHQHLTARERVVLELVCTGLTNHEIGTILMIAETTARGHVQSIIRKLDVRDRTAAAAEAVRRRLVA